MGPVDILREDIMIRFQQEQNIVIFGGILFQVKVTELGHERSNGL